MDAARLTEELHLLKGGYPNLEHQVVGQDNWVRIPNYGVPDGWSAKEVEIVFQIPTQVGQAPYGFYVRPALMLASGASASNYATSATTPWGSDFGKFSWSPLDQWVPKTDIRAGANMLNFALLFSDRFRETS